MSKAFTREENKELDDLAEDTPDPLEGLEKNYITPRGVERLRKELKGLLYNQRPELVKVVSWAASNGDRSENADYIYGKRRLRELDRRIRFLTKRLEKAEVIDPIHQSLDSVRFGATVTVRGENGKNRVYHIVGVDESNAKLGNISWISPIGKALLKTKVGDTVTVKMPRGDEDLEVIQIQYIDIPIE